MNVEYKQSASSYNRNKYIKQGYLRDYVVIPTQESGELPEEHFKWWDLETVREKYKNKPCKPIRVKPQSNHPIINENTKEFLSNWEKQSMIRNEYASAKYKWLKESDHNWHHPSQTVVVGDPHAPLFFEPGSVKSTYGTGAFLLLNTGSKKVYSKNRLLTTIGYRINGKTTYALEGTIFIAGAGVQWLRDKIKFIKKASDTEKIAKSLSSNKGIYLVPAFTGLGAPYWNVNARGILTGLTRDTGPKEITRATVESVAYQTYDLFEAMKNDGLKPKLIKVDGGMVLNNWFSQFLSDTINTKVLRPKVSETTALGAAFMAGLKIGVYKSLKDIAKNWQVDKSFKPRIKNSERKILIDGWSKAIKKTLS